MLDKNHKNVYILRMKQLGTDPVFSNLIVKEFDRKLHVRLRTASVKYGKSIRKITIEAIALWIKEENKKDKENREALRKHTNKNVGSNPTNPPTNSTGVVA